MKFLLVLPLLLAGCVGHRDRQHPHADGWRYDEFYQQWQQSDEHGVVTNVQPKFDPFEIK
jgi:hypothetical protein